MLGGSWLRSLSLSLKRGSKKCRLSSLKPLILALRKRRKLPTQACMRGARCWSCVKDGDGLTGIPPCNGVYVESLPDSASQFAFNRGLAGKLCFKHVEWEESADLLDVASKCDIVYQTRIQRQRFGERIDLYEEARGKYIVDQKVLGVMQKHAVVMPLPRLDEITVDVDKDSRAAYFRQAKNGLDIKMALLKISLLGW